MLPQLICCAACGLDKVCGQRGEDGRINPAGIQERSFTQPHAALVRRNGRGVLSFLAKSKCKDDFSYNQRTWKPRRQTASTVPRLEFEADVQAMVA